MLAQYVLIANRIIVFVGNPNRQVATKGGSAHRSFNKTNYVSNSV